MRYILTFTLLFVYLIGFSQLLADRIDYSKFDFGTFDSLMLNEINNRRIKQKLTPLIYDDFCHKVATYGAKKMVKHNSTNQFSKVEVDSVVLASPRDRFDYYKGLLQVIKVDEKMLAAEVVTGLRIGKNSRTFTYEKLVKFTLDEFFDGDIDNIVYRDYRTNDVYSAFSVQILEDEWCWNLFICGVLATK